MAPHKSDELLQSVQSAVSQLQTEVAGHGLHLCDAGVLIGLNSTLRYRQQLHSCIVALDTYPQTLAQFVLNSLQRAGVRTVFVRKRNGGGSAALGAAVGIRTAVAVSFMFEACETTGALAPIARMIERAQHESSSTPTTQPAIVSGSAYTPAGKATGKRKRR